MANHGKAIGLSVDGCHHRQQRLRKQLAIRGLEAALLTDPRHVHYLSGHWGRPIFETAMVILTDGPAVLATAFEPAADVAADEKLVFKSNHLATLVEDQAAVAINVLHPRLKGVVRLGCDDVRRPWLLTDFQIEQLLDTLLAMRRHKEPDEIAMVRRAVAATEAAYSTARQMLRPGVTEIEVHAAMHAAALREAGEPIGEFGNDFQSGTPGGPPRPRPVEAGELMVLDVSAVVRGYGSDMCRTFAVNRDPSSAQSKAQKLVVDALQFVEATVRPGVRCRKLYEDVHQMLHGHNDWKFFHHLGHGIGLACHEAPHLNPNWDDTFQIGDLFTAEPGLYGEDLRAGVRIENDLLVTETGVQSLCIYPSDL